MTEKLNCEIITSRGPTDEYESYLVVSSKGKTWPYFYIPETFPEDVLEYMLKAINQHQELVESERKAFSAGFDWGRQRGATLTESGCWLRYKEEGREIKLAALSPEE